MQITTLPVSIRLHQHRLHVAETVLDALELTGDDIECLIPTDTDILVRATPLDVGVPRLPTLPKHRKADPLVRMNTVLPRVGQRHLHVLARARKSASRRPNLIQPHLIGDMKRQTPNYLVVFDLTDDRKIRSPKTTRRMRQKHPAHAILIRPQTVILSEPRPMKPPWRSVSS